MTPLNLLISAVYYIAVAIIGFFSLFGVYILIRYGKSIIFGFVLSIVYALFFIQLLAQSLTTLHSLLS
jgi:hypothetical protein